MVWLWTLLVTYFLVTSFVMGFGIAEESRFATPAYHMVVVVAVAWPIVLPYAGLQWYLTRGEE